MRSTTTKVTSAILSGESFAEAISHHPSVFPPIYVELARVGETSGNLVQILEAVSVERQRAEALRRRLTDALRYPAFLLLAAGGVLLFFSWSFCRNSQTCSETSTQNWIRFS